jgi:glycosyltransferase involved in cell wall biosynthesis
MITKPIRVLDLCEAPVMGGPNTLLLTLSKGFANRDDVELIYAVLSNKPRGWLFDRMKEEGLPLYWIPCYRPPDIGVLRRIRKIIIEHHVDVVHTQFYRGDFYVRSLIDLNLVNLPTVITKHGLPPQYPLRNRLYTYLDKRPTRLATKVIAVDGHTKRVLVNFWKIPEYKIQLIHNPAPSMEKTGDEELSDLRQKLNFNTSIFIVLYLGRIEEDKGVNELFAAHESIHKKGLKLYTLFVGDGASKNSLMDRARSSPYGEFIRFVDQQLYVGPYLALADLVILPSYAEGLPMVLLESMAAAKPIVASNVGGIPDLVDHGINGFLVPPKDIEQLASAITCLVNNPEVMAEMGKRGQEKARTEFSLDSVVDANIRVYEDAMECFTSRLC